MKVLQKCFLLFLIWFNLSYSQNIVPSISARVDTTNVQVKEVYKLYKNYLNSKMDSIYNNPFWNQKEVDLRMKSKVPFLDNSSETMFFGQTVVKYCSFYKPKILQIDKINESRFQIKTIFMSRSEKEEDEIFTPDCIVKLYAVKDENGVFKLENAINYDTRNWKVYKYKQITYFVQPSVVFNQSEAKKAVRFCQEVQGKFNLKEVPISYYITNSSDELGKLFNFEYILSYSTGRTNSLEKIIYTSFSNENYPHEFTHLLFSNINKNPPRIINEGVATWLGGPKFNESFEENLKILSLQIRNNNTISLDDIISFKYRNPFDNNPLYVTGAVICKMAYEKKGAAGVMELYTCKEDVDSLKKGLEKVFDAPYNKINDEVIKYIKDYASLK
jgi:hypothetical protein